MKESEVFNLHKKFLNSSYIDLIQNLGHGKYFKKSCGTKIYDESGNEYTDFLAGYGVHNIGHNNKELISHLHKELDSQSPTFLNMDAASDSALLAEKLSKLTDGELNRVSFSNSGSEAVETALKTAIAATGKSAIISCKDSYHGLSIGAISLMDDELHRKPFGNLLQNVHKITFGNIKELEDKIKKVKPAAFIVEPIQSEGGIIVPEVDYLEKISKICKKNKVILIIDEIQTGIGRCGSMLFTDFKRVKPDIVLLGKALSGGLIPISACIMSEKVYKKSHHGLNKCFLYESTFSGGHLACQCSIKTITIIENSNLLKETNEKGDYLLKQLSNLKDKHKIIKDIRGTGLLIGIEFLKPTGLISNTLPKKIKESIFTYIVSAKLMKDYKLILQACSIRGNVLRIEPPLTITKKEIDFLLDSIDNILTEIPNHKTALSKLIKNKIFRSDI